MTWSNVTTTSPKLNVGPSSSMSFSNLNSLNFNTKFNSPTYNTDSILYANQNATININNVGDVNFGSNSKKLYVDQAVHAFGGKFIATDINNFNLNATGGGVLMAQNLNGSEALIKIEAKDDINITTNKEVKPNGSTNSAMAITSGSYYNGGKTEYNLSAKGNVNIIAPDSAVTLYMSNFTKNSTGKIVNLGNGDNIVSINGEQGVTIKGGNGVRLDREDTKSTSGNYIATITSTNGKVNLDTASTAILITNKNSVKNDKTEVNIDADSINISSKNGDAIDITNNATVNFESDKDTKISGSIFSTDNSTINLNSGGNTSIDNTIYIANNSNVKLDSKGNVELSDVITSKNSSVDLTANGNVSINKAVNIYDSSNLKLNNSGDIKLLGGITSNNGNIDLTTDGNTSINEIINLSNNSNMNINALGDITISNNITSDNSTINITDNNDSSLYSSNSKSGSLNLSSVNASNNSTMKFNIKGDINIAGNVSSTTNSTVNLTSKDSNIKITGDISSDNSTINLSARKDISVDKEIHISDKSNVNLDSQGSTNLAGDIIFSDNSIFNLNAKNDISINKSVDISNNSTVNFDSQGNIAILGDITSSNNSIVNLSANGDTSSSSGKYSISKNSQVNFNKGEWTVNNWSGDDTGSVTIGENAKVNINHQVAISNLDVKDGSTTVVNADKLGSDSAFKVSDNATVNIGNNSSLYVNGADLNQKYTIIDGYNGLARWDKVYTDNKLISYGQDISDDNLVLESQINDLNKVFKDNKVVISNAIQGSANTKAYDFFKTTANLQDEKMAANAINSVANMGELAGVNHVSYSATNLMTNAVHTHLSKLNDTKQEDNLWAEYIHSKEKVDGMNLGGLDTKYNAIFNGIIVGSDLYNEGKTTAGMAFSYIDASIHGNTFSSYTKNDAQYYGLSLYGRIDNGDNAILGDISYMHSNNDITQKNTNNEITASPHSDTFTIGSSVEQYYNVGAGVLSPFAGLRYMHLGTGDYTNSLGMRYDVDEQNIWLLPIGVSYTAPYQKGDWNISPYAKASYIWAFGDTDTSQTVALNNNFDTFGFDVVDKDSFVGEIGLNVDSEKMGYSLSYGYQKGDNVQANKWSANVIFKF